MDDCKNFVEDYVVQFRSKKEKLTDKRILRSKLFDVNMRLYNNNFYYRTIIRSIIAYMCDIMDKEFKNYPKGRGISGSNVGIPFNIAIIRKAGENKSFFSKLKTTFKRLFTIKKKNELYVRDKLVMINPQIINISSKTVIKKSNCGSLCLPKSIKVQRYETVTVYFWTFGGVETTEKIDKSIASTVQHEIDHLNGILITDKQISEGDSK